MAKNNWTSRMCACFSLLAVMLLALGLVVPATLASAEPLTAKVLIQDEPIANTGGWQNVTQGANVTLNGSASFGFEGADKLNYTWNITHKDNSTYLYGMIAYFIANDSGRYDVNLTVRDSLNRTDWELVYVISREKPKTWLEKYWGDLVILAIVAAVGLYYLAITVAKVRRGDKVITEAGREKIKLSMQRYRKIFRQLLKSPMGLAGFLILAFFIILAIVGPFIAPYDVSQQDLNNDMMPPSKAHWLGTDNFGKDVFSELLVGARTSIIVGMVSAVIASFLGALVGLYSGYVGGIKDEIIMRLNDIVLSIPWLVLMIIVAALIGTLDLTGIILIIGLTGWSTTARMVRAQVLSVKERQYIERARAIGASEMSIIKRHIFPNTFPLVFANTILTVAVSILSEATLSFLHLRPIGSITWGTMLSYAHDSSAFQNDLQGWIVAPGLCIVIVVLGFTLLGYALDEILNPKLRKR